MADGSLSSVVSSLVRAQMGTSVPSQVTDEDLDRHVAELILKEAKKKAEQYDKQGIRAYLPQQESNVPKTNKRFLSSIIRNTDDHNKSILRAQALSAAEIRIEREAQERAERRVRAEEAAAAERARRSRRGRDDSRERKRKHRARSRERVGSDDEDEDRWQSSKRRRRDHADERHGSRSARRSRHDEDGSSRRRRHRSRSEDDEDKERRRHRRSRVSRSRSPRGSVGQSSRGGGDTSAPKRPRSLSPSDPEDEGHISRRRLRRQGSRSSDAGDAPGADSHTRHKRRSHRHHTSHRTRHRSRSRSRTPEKPPRSETLSEGLGSGSRPSGSRASSQPLATEQHSACDRAERASSDLRRKVKGKGKASFMETESQYERSTTSIPGPVPHDSSPNPSRSPSPGPRPPPGPPPPLPPPADFTRDSVRPDLPSKMDKYFEASYDPRLDVAPLSAPNVPATGLVNNAEFEGWDAMLELIKQKRVDKAERKRLERHGLVEKSGKEKKKSKSKIAGIGVAGTLAGWSEEGGNALMDIEYKKRGSVREWDLGKETPT